MESKRLRFRRFRTDDLDHIVELESDPEVVKHTPMKLPLSREQSAERLKKNIESTPSREPLGIWAAETHDGDFVGWFMLLPIDLGVPELGFMIVRRHWGKGFTTEAGALLVKYALEELLLPRLLAVTTLDNFASQRVLEKIGFRRIATSPKGYHYEIKRLAGS
jgi:RimJ/RimL family protein N-acetyltransferase